MRSIPGFEAYCTDLEDEAHEDVDSDAHEVADLYELDGDHDFSTGLLSYPFSCPADFRITTEEREEKGKKRS